MTKLDLRNAVESALAQIDFEPPVTVEYCQAVYSALKGNVNMPENSLVDVFHRHVEVVVRAQVDRVVFEMTLPCA